jgi:hypothetical protein
MSNGTMRRTVLFATTGVAAVLMTVQVSLAGIADFEVFHIRNNDGSITAPWDGDIVITENSGGTGFSAVTPRSGQKVGFGTHAFDGKRINTIETASFDKVSGVSGIVPYLNMWVTDGANHAIISSENDYRGADFATRQEWKVFEYDAVVGLDWLFDAGVGGRVNQYLTLNGVNATLADLSDSIILSDPGAPYPGYVGTGAPRGGYSFNVIFGDTQANYVGSYEIENLSVVVDGTSYAAANAVPEPSTLAIWGVLGGLGLIAARRGRKTA